MIDLTIGEQVTTYILTGCSILLILSFFYAWSNFKFEENRAQMEEIRTLLMVKASRLWNEDERAQMILRIEAVTDYEEFFVIEKEIRRLLILDEPVYL